MSIKIFLSIAVILFVVPACVRPIIVCETPPNEEFNTVLVDGFGYSEINLYR